MFAVRQPEKAVEVGGTHIFARVDAQGWQWLAYEMSVRAPEDPAMVLPVPVARQDPSAFAFVDLERYPELFDHLSQAIYVWGRQRFQAIMSLSGDEDSGPARLPVHQVGAYEASFVPDLAAFARLDERFQLSEAVRRQLPDYSRFGFAVFKLTTSRAKSPERVHAMAFRFQARDPDMLFFPTVHVHDGTWHERAEFDHMLYLQGGPWGLPGNLVYLAGRQTTPEAITSNQDRWENAERHERSDGRMRAPYGVVRSSWAAVERGGKALPTRPARPRSSSGYEDLEIV
ncbi:MAG: hypothetical protein WBL29_01755 [Burkholderiales bacterium]